MIASTPSRSSRQNRAGRVRAAGEPAADPDDGEGLPPRRRVRIPKTVRRIASSAWRSGDSAAIRAAMSLIREPRASVGQQAPDLLVGQPLDLRQQALELRFGGARSPPRRLAGVARPSRSSRCAATAVTVG